MLSDSITEDIQRVGNGRWKGHHRRKKHVPRHSQPVRRGRLLRNVGIGVSAVVASLLFPLAQHSASDTPVWYAAAPIEEVVAQSIQPPLVIDTPRTTPEAKPSKKNKQDRGKRVRPGVVEPPRQRVVVQKSIPDTTRPEPEAEAEAPEQPEQPAPVAKPEPPEEPIPPTAEPSTPLCEEPVAPEDEQKPAEAGNEHEAEGSTGSVVEEVGGTEEEAAG